MTNVKERILGAVTIMDEASAEKLWNFIQMYFTLNHMESVNPQEDEIQAFQEYRSGNTEYQPFITQEELLKELGLS